MNDAHCHFFSEGFFDSLARQRGRSDSAGDLCRELQWEAPGASEALAGRWVSALDAAGVSRAALIASVPGDESSVAAAVAHAPGRFVGFFMIDPSAPGAVDRAQRALGDLRLRALCLFPAMSHVPLDDARTEAIVEVAAEHPGTAVFVHCGVLSVGVRKKLGLPSRFDQRLGDPLAVAQLATRYPAVPFIIPSFGAGMFRETLMAGDVSSNIYVDTSSSNSWMRYTPGLTLPSVFRATLDVLGPSRILFGTDSSFFPRGWQRPVYEAQRAALTELGVSDQDRTLVMAANFDRLFARS